MEKTYHSYSLVKTDKIQHLALILGQLGIVIMFRTLPLNIGKHRDSRVNINVFLPKPIYHKQSFKLDLTSFVFTGDIPL